jgi:hypothetical protein
MLSTVLGLALLVLLIGAALPVPRLRQAVLTFTARAAQSAVLAAVAVCGTLFVQPEATPAWATPHAAPVLDAVRAALPASLAALPGLPWLALAVLIVAAGLPVLSVVDFAARVAAQTAAVQTLRRELRFAADVLDRKLARLTEPPPPAIAAAEVAAAADAMRAVAGDPQPPRVARPLYVRDLL